MLTRRTFTRWSAQLLAAGLLAQGFTPLAAAQQLQRHAPAEEAPPVDEQVGGADLADQDEDESQAEDLDQDQDDDQDIEDQEDETDEGVDEDKDAEEDKDVDEGEAPGEHPGQTKKDGVTPAPELIAQHDNGKHLGLLKSHKNDKLRGVGFWRQVSTGEKK